MNIFKKTLDVVDYNFSFFAFCFFIVSPYLATETQATIRQLRRPGLCLLTNEKHCRRLCWYLRLCTGYLYNKQLATNSAVTSANYNCILRPYADEAAVGVLIGASSGWMENPASGSNINNGCNTRPCNYTEVCVPTSSTSASSHVCLPLTSQCDVPKAVSHGNVSVSGDSQGDVANVTCDEGYVASPKGVSMELVCLVTARWTPFVGVCQQYEFVVNSTDDFGASFPWKFELDSNLCVKGIFHNRSIVQLSQPGSIFRISNRYVNEIGDALIWNVRKDGNWLGWVMLEEKPLLRGDRFYMTIRLLNDALQVVLNDANTYSIPLADIQFDFGQAEALQVKGMRTYVNLIAGC